MVKSQISGIFAKNSNQYTFMIRKTCSFILFLLCSLTSWAQQTYDLSASKSDPYKPSIQVFLPAADKANGCAVILCPGGGMRALSWDSDVEQMATFLNERGIAAIGLKYHLNNLPFPQGMKMEPMVDVTHLERFPQADANPLHYPAGDSILQLAADDAKAAIRLVRKNAQAWHLDTQKIGYLGFSAGGGVAIAATIQASEPAERPNFLCTNFGPSLMPVQVPNPAPPLLIMTRADHQNVAAGLVNLFLEWKKAGGNAEIHLYGDGTGPYTLMPQTGRTTTEAWSQHFILWLQAKGFY